MKTKEEIEQLAERWLENANTEKWGGEVIGYIKGYTQCQEDMDKKYTEGDTNCTCIAFHMTDECYKLGCKKYRLNKQD